MGCKNSKTGYLTLTTPLSGKIFHCSCQCTKYEVSWFTRYEAVNGGTCEMQKMGWFEVVRRHSRLTAMSPFDRAPIRPGVSCGGKVK